MMMVMIRGTKDGWVVNGKANGELDERRVLETRVDGACIGSDVVAVARRGEDGSRYVKIRCISDFLL